MADCRPTTARFAVVDVEAFQLSEVVVEVDEDRQEGCELQDDISD
jgi:hypothetical protein